MACEAVGCETQLSWTVIIVHEGVVGESPLFDLVKEFGGLVVIVFSVGVGGGLEACGEMWRRVGRGGGAGG